MREFDYERLSLAKWDNDILLKCAKIHECKGRQELFVKQKPAQLTRLIEIARIQSTEASNRIEGIVTTSTRMKQLISEKTAPRNRSEKEIIGYRDALRLIHESYEYIDISPNHILQIHSILLKPAQISHAGKFKSVQNYIKETKEDGTELIRFTPLSPYETPEAVSKACESFNRALAMECIDPLILIPIFISDFLCIHPFNDGNGRMSRLLTLLLLYKCGFEVGKFISLEKQIEKTKDIYYDVLQDIDSGWHESENDPTPYIKYMLDLLLACYTEFESRLRIMDSIGIKSSSYDIVKTYVDNHLGKFKSSELIANCTTIGRSSILSALKRLVDEGYVEKHGTKTSTFYTKSKK